MATKTRYRLVVARYVKCPVRGHLKTVSVCHTRPYDECGGCEVIRGDREHWGKRTHRVIDTNVPPGVGFDETEMRSYEEDDSDLTIAGTLTKAFKRMRENDGRDKAKKDSRQKRKRKK